MSKRSFVIQPRSEADLLAQLGQLAKSHPDPLDRRAAGLLKEIVAPVLREFEAPDMTGQLAVELMASTVASLVASIALRHLPPSARIAFVRGVLDQATLDASTTLRLDMTPSDRRPS